MKQFLSFSMSVLCVLACVTLSCASPKDKDAAPQDAASGSAVSKAAPPQNTAPAAAPAVPKVGEFKLSPFADSLKKNFHVDLCCNSPLETCVAQKSPDCGIALRLLGFLEQLDNMKTLNRITDERLTELMQSRHDMFKDTQRFNNDVSGWPVIGDANAPVTVVMYVSGTCPTCKTNFRDLHAEVTRGRLKGKAKIITKPLNPHISNLAAFAAHDLGLFSEFMFHLANAGRFNEETTPYEIADRLYIDRQRFKSAMENPELLKRIQASAVESEKNGVTHVPTYFIMGRKYNSILIPFWIADAIEYIHETETGG